MPSIRFYNLTRSPAAFPGVAGTVRAASAKTATVTRFEMDSMPPMALSSADIGLFAYDPSSDEVYLPIWRDGGVKFIQTNGNLSLSASMRGIAITAGSGVVVTLVAANAVPKGTRQRVLVDLAATGGIVRRAGADTINGAITDITLTTANPLCIVESDGVSNWKSL